MIDYKNWEHTQYQPLVKHILEEGEYRESRAGNVRSIFSSVIRIDQTGDVAPLLIGRRMYYKGVLGELAGMLKGPKNKADFKLFGCNYWDDWADEETGELHLDYGNAWLDFNGVNQLKDVVYKLKNNPTDRRILVSGWRPDRLNDLSLPCCHLLYQWYVREGKYLDMIWYQRSADLMVGVPSDIFFAGVWNAALAMQTGYTPGRITFIFGDTHIYENHFNEAWQYLNKTLPLEEPYLKINPDVDIFKFQPEDVSVINYKPLSPIKFKLNV